MTLLACAAACACTPARRGGGAAAAPDAISWAEVVRLQRARHYFALRTRLATVRDSTLPPALFARAFLQHAFNAPGASNATIGTLIAAGGLPDSLVTELRRVQVANDLRLSDYAAGLAAADTLLAHSGTLDSATVRDIRNTRRVFRALSGTPPQRVEMSGPTRLRLDHGRVPLKVNDSTRSYVFDSGANLSTLMRSEAAALGLRVLPAGIDVGTSTDLRVTADLAVADDLTIGSLHYRHVVFLVLDDRLLTFPDGFRIPGIIGFPVIEQMGEVQFGRDGALMVPDTPPRRSQRNLALDELTPLVRVGWNGKPLLCRLDTGASATELYEPFYRRFQRRIDSASRPVMRRMGGAGGISETPVRVMSSARLSLGDTVATLDSVDVLLRSIVPTAEQNYLDCNIGHDVLDAFSGYILNFRDMAFLLN